MTHFTDLIDLASESFGGMVEFANDEFFAEKENLIKASDPVFYADRYTDHGKWMDGWESRRKRELPGHDFAILRLGLAGVIRGVVVDTAFFTGNFPDRCAIEGCALPGFPKLADVMSDDVEWFEVLPMSDLQGDHKNAFEVHCHRRVTHLKFRIYPDGGVARLRVYGQCAPDWPRLLRAGHVDLAAAENGGLVLEASDMHYGNKHNMIMPGRARHMGEGWETKRRRGPGNDWAILQLAAPGEIASVEVDTNHFKGNYPDRCSLEVINIPGATADELRDAAWRPLLPQTKLRAHTRHYFSKELTDVGAVSHVRLQIYPDGGVSRFRVNGTLSAEIVTALMLDRFNLLSDKECVAELITCCGATRWAAQLADARPFTSLEGLTSASDEVWASMGRDDVMEAFSCHPRIGERKAASTAVTQRSAAWSTDEQSGVDEAEVAIKAQIAAGNVAYEERFGYIYIVCASGKSAKEMLAILNGRLGNDPEAELAIAAGEQRKITNLRLEKLLLP